MEKLLSIKQYLDKHQISQRDLAELIGISQPAINRYVKFNTPCSPETHQKLLALGIDHPKGKMSYNGQRKENLGRPPKFSTIPLVKRQVKPVKSKEEINSKILKNFQVDCVKGWGNTIVSKKFTIDEIIQEYQKFGLTVSVHHFTSFHYGLKDSHYVVRLTD